MKYKELVILNIILVILYKEFVIKIGLNVIFISEKDTIPDEFVILI